MSKEYPALLKRLTIRFKRLEKFGFPMIFLNLYLYKKASEKYPLFITYCNLIFILRISYLYINYNTNDTESNTELFLGPKEF